MISRRAAGLLVVTATALAFVARAVDMGSGSFPVNDGGMFYSLTQDLVRNGFVPPALTTYNQGGIPFAYPPLGLYLAGTVHVVLGIDLLTLFRVLPLVASCLTVPAAYLVARELMGSPLLAGLAAMAFGLLPSAFTTQIAGGGVLRAPAYLLGLLALHRLLVLLRTRRAADAALTALLLGLTGLTHPQAFAMSLVSGALLWAWHGDWRRTAAPAAAALGVGLVLPLAWVGYVAAHAGPGPFASAAQAGPDWLAGILYLGSSSFTGNPLLDVLGTLGLAGLLLEAMAGRWMLVVWLVLMLRVGWQYAMLPLALAAALALAALLPVVQQLAGPSGGSLLRTHRRGVAILAGIMLVGLVAAAAAPLDPSSKLHSLDDAQVAAIDWVGQNVPAEDAVVVVTGLHWWEDSTSEWLPALTDRRSVATVQGTEWLGASTFAGAKSRYADLQACARETASCVLAWVRSNPAQRTWILVPRGQLRGPLSPDDCCVALRETLNTSVRVRLEFDGPGGSVYRVLPDSMAANLQLVSAATSRSASSME